MSINADIQTLEPGELIQLFDLDATAIGGDLLHFHGHMHVGPIWWQGNEYSAWPIEATDFEMTSDAQQPTPKLSVGNIDGSITAMCIYLDDLVGAQLTRRRTFGKYLDSLNFPDGNIFADPAQELPQEVWVVQRKSSEDNTAVEFELSSPLDFSGVQIPARVVQANNCPWAYRGLECGYFGGAIADTNDQPVTDISLDRCGKRLGSCQLRFGQYQPLRFGGFPAADLTGTSG
jgi:lambda family phage minor tail protein L